MNELTELQQAARIAFASEFSFYLKAHEFHWNVEGPDFYQLHKFLQKIYEASYETIDVIAEEIRTLNEYTPGSFERFQELSQIIGQTKVPRGQLMLEELLADSNVLIGLITQTFDVANAENKQDIANYMAELLANYNKFKWQLQSFLKVARA